MKRFTLLALITAALLAVSTDGQALRGGTTHVAKEAIIKKGLRLVGKGIAYPLVKIYDGAKYSAKWVIEPARLDRAWIKSAQRGATAYLALSLAVLPLCSNLVCGSRDASLVADRLVQERIPEGEMDRLVVYANGEGEQVFGVERSSRLVFSKNDADHSIVSPLTSVREVFDYVSFFDIPLFSIDGVRSADGAWQVLNWDLLPDALLAKRVDRDEVIEVSIAGKIVGDVRIEEEATVLLGQGIVKLTDNNSDDELYAVLIDRKLAQETLADSGEAALVEQDIKPYFRFLTAAEFAASRSE